MSNECRCTTVANSLPNQATAYSFPKTQPSPQTCAQKRKEGGEGAGKKKRETKKRDKKIRGHDV